MSRQRSGLVLVLVAAALLAAAAAPAARADGDPGSDVLVYQDLFAGSDAGLSVQQQLELSGLLKATARAGAPVRVAVIASRLDLGAVTGLWRNPRAYARFLGIELSLVYKQRLLVVMPDGFGFNWPGHSPAAAYRALGSIPIQPGGDGVFNATEAAVRKLMLASGVKLPAEPASAVRNGAGQGAGQPSGNGTDNTLGIVALSLVALVGIVLAVPRTVGRHRWPRPGVPRRLRARLRLRGRLLALPGAALLAIALAAVAVIVGRSSGPGESQADALAKNPYLDPGTPPVGRGARFHADRPVRPAGLAALVPRQGGDPGLQRLGVHDDLPADHDRDARRQGDARHRRLAGAAVGSRRQSDRDLARGRRVLLRAARDGPPVAVPHRLAAAAEAGVEGTTGSRRRSSRRDRPHAGAVRDRPAGPTGPAVLTQQSYTAVAQLGQLLAQEASRLLPAIPRVHAEPVLRRDQAEHGPTVTRRLPRAGGGTVELGPGAAARLYLFFATWDRRPAPRRRSSTR